jgi:hypothetical protein
MNTNCFISLHTRFSFIIINIAPNLVQHQKEKRKLRIYRYIQSVNLFFFIWNTWFIVDFLVDCQNYKLAPLRAYSICIIYSFKHEEKIGTVHLFFVNPLALYYKKRKKFMRAAIMTLAIMFNIELNSFQRYPKYFFETYWNIKWSFLRIYFNNQEIWHI